MKLLGGLIQDPNSLIKLSALFQSFPPCARNQDSQQNFSGNLGSWFLVPGG